MWIASVTKGEWDVPKAVKVLMSCGEQLKVIDNDNQVSHCLTDKIVLSVSVKTLITMSKQELLINCHYCLIKII